MPFDELEKPLKDTFIGLLSLTNKDFFQWILVTGPSHNVYSIYVENRKGSVVYFRNISDEEFDLLIKCKYIKNLEEISKTVGISRDPTLFIKFEITKKAIEEYESHSSVLVEKSPKVKTKRKKNNKVISSKKVFISHSSKDAELAELLGALLRTALKLSKDDIRITSVDGYRLPGGVNSEDQLRNEIKNSLSFIGLISSDSIESPYVLFELGARWGFEKTLIPLLAPGVEAGILKGPISNINTLSCGSGSQLYQLIEEIGKALNISIERASSFQPEIEKISAYIKSEPAFENADSITEEDTRDSTDSFDIQKAIGEGSIFISNSRNNAVVSESEFLLRDKASILMLVYLDEIGEGLTNAPDNKYIISHQTDDSPADSSFNNFSFRYTEDNHWEVTFSDSEGNFSSNPIKVKDGLTPGWHQFIISWNLKIPRLVFIIDGNEMSRISKGLVNYWPREIDDSITIGAFVTRYNTGFVETKMRNFWIINEFINIGHEVIDLHLLSDN